MEEKDQRLHEFSAAVHEWEEMLERCRRAHELASEVAALEVLPTRLPSAVLPRQVPSIKALEKEREESTATVTNLREQ